jgi:hypothetical protein
MFGAFTAIEALVAYRLRDTSTPVRACWFCRKLLQLSTYRETVQSIPIVQQPHPIIFRINPQSNLYSTQRRKNRYASICFNQPPKPFCEHNPPPHRLANTPRPPGAATPSPQPYSLPPLSPALLHSPAARSLSPALLLVCLCRRACSSPDPPPTPRPPNLVRSCRALPSLPPPAVRAPKLWQRRLLRSHSRLRPTPWMWILPRAAMVRPPGARAAAAPSVFAPTTSRTWILILPRAVLVNSVSPNDLALLWCECVQRPPGTNSFLPPLSPPLRIAVIPFFL